VCCRVLQWVAVGCSVLQCVAVCIAVETSDLGLHSRLHCRRHPSYSIICLRETLHLFGSNPPLKAALQRDSSQKESLCITVQTSDLGLHSRRHPSNYIKEVLQCVAVCCSVLQCVAVCCSVLQCVAVCCRMLQRVAECLQGVAVCCSCRCNLRGFAQSAHLFGKKRCTCLPPILVSLSSLAPREELERGKGKLTS